MKDKTSEILLFEAMEEQRLRFLEYFLIELEISELSEEKIQKLLEILKTYEKSYYQLEYHYQNEKKFNDWYFKPV